MTINRKICPAGLKNNPNKNLTAIKYITIHCTGNYTATAGAKNHADYVYTGSGGAQTSWHYTIDGKEIWQHFEDRQECWHAGDGTNGPGNSTSIGLEICVNNKAAFKQACENAAWLTSELLKKHGLTIDKVVQHNKWNGKNCPAELCSGAWGVTWADFIAMVKAQFKQNPPEADVSIPAPAIKKGDTVKLATNAVYYDGKAIPAWVKSLNWIVSYISGNRAVMDKSADGKNSICSPVNMKFLTVVKTADSKPAAFKAYTVKVTDSALNIRKGPGTNYAVVGVIKDKGVYTIVEEAVSRWGRLKSGAGWISLDLTKKI